MDHGELPQGDQRCVAITGGTGRLGSSLTFYLTSLGYRVRILDMDPPAHGIACEFRRIDMSVDHDMRSALRGCDAVVHLAALHGPHLLNGGVARSKFWRVNVTATARALWASKQVGVRRFVLASSTSVYGSGSEPGAPARVLDEHTELAPENVYDISKIAAERLTGQARRNGLETIALRFGRFFFPSQSDYHLRKLSTGLDVYDACQAVALALSRPLTDQAVYCVASDLALTRRQREDLGLDLPKVLRDVLPGFAEKIAARGWSLPARVGKSVDTSLIQEDFGYRPQRNLAWINRVAAKHAEMSTVLSESPAAADEGVRGGLGGSHQALADAIGWDIHRSPAC